MRFRLGAALCASALAATVIVPAVAANAASTPTPYFMTWKPGTTLPAVPAGYKLVALAPQAKTLATGHDLTMTPVSRSLAKRQPGAYSAYENKAGVVDLEAEPVTPNGLGCTPIVYESDLGSHTGIVMASFSTIAGVTQVFTYGSGQSSTLGIGDSTSGDDGSFSADGTTSISTDFVQGFNPQVGRSFNDWQTWFEIGEYYQACPAQDFWYTWPFQWNAGTFYAHPAGAPGATHCTPENPGDSGTQYTTTASTVKLGWNSGALGFDGTAQTGYSYTAEIEFKYTVKAQLCGVNNTPPNSPGVLVAS